MNTQIPLDTKFDVTFANEIAGLEIYNKHHYRPNSYLHKWWARRCGSTFRLILKHLVPEENARDYYAPGGLAGRVILDPMMGGGTTLHEAIRMEANVMGVDLDPIPVLQARAGLRPMPLLELEQAYRRFHKALRRRLDWMYETSCPRCGRPTQIRYVLHGWRRHCACGPALFLDGFVLRQEADGGRIGIDPASHAIWRETAKGERTTLFPGSLQERPPLAAKGSERCDRCGDAYGDDRSRPFYDRYEPVVIVGRCGRHGRFFKPPDEEDWAIWRRADGERPSLPFDPDSFRVQAGRKSRQLIWRDVENYLDLFSTRQLSYLAAAIAELAPFSDPIRLNLALLVSTSLEFNSMLCGYKGAAKRRSGAIRHTFSHHAYAFPYTALENNPLFRRKASGTLHKLFRARVRAHQWADAPRERKVPGDTAEFRTIPEETDGGEEMTDPAALQRGTRRFWLRQGTATALPLPDDCVDYVITDPPYYDSVQYSDLAAFFRVWLRRLLPDAAEWEYDVSASAVDPHKNDAASRYQELIGDIFAECHRVLRRNGRFVFTFHHWNPKGWAAITLALRRAGFVLVNRYVVRAESPVSVHINNMKALLHDAILVLAPAEAGIGGEWKRPSAINDADSEDFTRDCATLLGWMLASDLAESEVQAAWREAVQGKGD